MQAPRIWRHFDVWLLAAVALMTIAGVAMIQSAIAGNEFLVEQNTVSRQVIFGLAGFAVLFLTAAIDYRLWSALSRPMYIFILAFLALIPIAGIAGFGSARWFQVGVITIQPSELAKILITLVLADFLSRNQYRIHEARTLIRSLILVVVPAILVFVQPDLSTAIVLGVIWLALVWAAGAHPKHLVMLAVAAMAAPLLAFPFLQNYQIDRVTTFLFPDPEAGFGATYNVNQALIAIGSGGLFGQGYSSGTQVQLRFLKVRHTDFIFSAMAEEFGFIGAIILIALFVFIIYRCLRAARMARDTYGALICYGFAILMFFQGFFNIGMNLKLFPVSGLPLPFFSYGGSSLFTSLLAIGLVESVNLRHKQIEL
ncbi:MAG: rod shape-determining protein RodA [Anaerolineales bacterium]|jgi:rod shape determining protein RodA